MFIYFDVIEPKGNNYGIWIFRVKYGMGKQHFLNIFFEKKKKAKNFGVS